MLRRLLAAAFAALTLAAVLPSAQANAETFGWRWVSTSIPVFSDVPASWKVDTAIANWNAKNTVHLYRVDSPTQSFGITVHEVDAVGDGGIVVGGAQAVGWANSANVGTPTQTCTVTLKRLTAESFKPTAVTHEFGHCLGLDHTTHRGSIMAATLSIVAPNKPSTWDYSQLAGLYSKAKR